MIFEYSLITFRTNHRPPPARCATLTCEIRALNSVHANVRHRLQRVPVVPPVSIATVTVREPSGGNPPRKKFVLSRWLVPLKSPSSSFSSSMEVNGAPAARGSGASAPWTGSPSGSAKGPVRRRPCCVHMAPHPICTHACASRPACERTKS